MIAHLIRHGQAGSRLQYDELSETGHRQAELLADYLADQKVQFRAIYAGGLRRQRETAEKIAQALKAEIVTVPEWSEFDLDEVYRDIAPRLCEDDDCFRGQYEAFQRELGNAGSGVHRAWTGTDVSVVQAWIEGRYPCEGESFDGFCERVGRGMDGMGRFGKEDEVAVVTSATPIAIWIGRTLELGKPRVMQLAGAMRNTAISRMEVTGEELRLLEYNAVPHLCDPRLRTVR